MRQKFHNREKLFIIILIHTFLSLFWLSDTGLIFAQHYNFRTYSVEEGLAQSQVYIVYQCRHGYLWAGMFGGGLSRFDGKNFKNYSTKDGLSDNVVYSIIEGRLGNLWMGTDVGLNKYNCKVFTNYTQEDGLVQDSVRIVYEDRNGGLWLGTYSGGLSFFKNGGFVNFTAADGLTDNRIRSIFQDSQGNLWVGTLKGLNKFNGKIFVDCMLTRRLRDYQIFSILEDSQGKFWFGTGKGAYCFDGKKIITYTTAEGLSHNNINCVFQQSSGDIWITTHGGANCLEFDTGRIASFTTQEGLPNDNVEAVTEDREGNLWFSTDGGISKFSGKTFTYFSTRDGLKDNMVWSLWEDPDGNIWIGSEKGVALYNEEKGTLVNMPLKWEGIAYPFYEGSQGNLWFGTGTTVIKYDGQNYIDINESLHVDNYNVLSILEDQQGNFWFGTESNGVKKYDGQRMTDISRKDGLLDTTVNFVMEDYRGNIWMGTNSGISIYLVKKKRFVNITTRQWLPSKYVMSLLQDRDNSFWIGTYGGGVVHYGPSQNMSSISQSDEDFYTQGVVETFSTKDGLVDDEVLLMVFDDRGNLWLGTNKGIGVIDTNELKKTGKKRFKYYGKEDGFFGIECAQNACYKDSHGHIWFGTIRGAIKYSPEEDETNLVEPMVHITNVNLFFETKLGLPDNLELKYNQNHLTFEFIGISLTVPEKVMYQVKLEGFDTNWSPISRTNFATYSNIPPGNYTFKVKACNNSGVWTKEPTIYTIRIKAPFWKTWWFSLLVFAVTIGSVWGFIKIRVRQLKRHQRILKEEVHNRTLELEQEKAKVEQINLQLEQRVEERTRKLEIANKQLLNAQKMEAIGLLAGGVAHDLNNVLGGIINYPDLLLLESPANSIERNYLSAIKRSGEKASAIVQDLLTLARRGVTVDEVVNINQVIKEFLQSPELEKLLSYHQNIRIETHLHDQLLNTRASQIHLLKVIMNLISNAAEAMPEGGNIIVSTENCFLSGPVDGYDEVQKGEYVRFKVTDTGIGIPKEDLERIFEPFYTKKKMGRSGTGLGMCVVWGIVKDHNGYINIDSEVGKGTCFSLYFPATKLKCTEKEEHLSISQLEGNGEAILVVDDVEEQREVTTLMLRQLGYAVCNASSGEEAIEFISDNPVDIIVLDMIMEPGISGLDTYKRILELYPDQKAVIVSGFSENDDVKKAQQLGAGTYVKKPYDLEKIGRAVKSELQRLSDG